MINTVGTEIAEKQSSKHTRERTNVRSPEKNRISWVLCLYLYLYIMCVEYQQRFEEIIKSSRTGVSHYMAPGNSSQLLYKRSKYF